jgi:glutaredoxin
MRIALLAGVVLAVSCGAASAQMYRWVDKDGRTHYTQTPPPPDARNVERKALGAGADGGAAKSYADLPYASQAAARNYPVTLYTSPDCGAPCDQARALLVRRAVPFKEISVQRPQDVENLKSAGGTQVPHIIVGSLKQSGFLEDAYGALLDTAGYPTSGPRLSVDALRTMDGPATQGSATGEGPAKSEEPAR